jgi:hypothetical protein
VTGDQHIRGVHLVSDQCIAVAVRGGFQFCVAVGTVNFHFHAADRRTVMQRRDMQQSIVVVDAQMQTQIADKESRRVITLGKRAALFDHGHINARLRQL